MGSSWQQPAIASSRPGCPSGGTCEAPRPSQTRGREVLLSRIMKLQVVAAVLLVLQGIEGAARPKGLLFERARAEAVSLVQPLFRPSAALQNVRRGYTEGSDADFVPNLPGYGEGKDGKLDFGLYAG